MFKDWILCQSYVEAVITKQSGNVTMQLACKVAFDLYTESSIDYLNSQNAEADICFDKDIDFNQVLKEYVTEKKHLFFKSEEPQEKQTRSIDFTIQEAKTASEKYISDLWKAIKESLLHRPQ